MAKPYILKTMTEYSTYLERIEEVTSAWYEYIVMCRAINLLLTNVPRNQLVLDVGCGTGKYSFFLRKIGFTKVIGMDISHNLIKTAKRRVHSLCGSAFNMPFRDKSFHLVFSTAVVEHVQNPISFIRKLTSILNDGGFLFIMTPNPSSWALAPYRGHQQHEGQFERFIHPENLVKILTNNSSLKLVKTATTYFLPGPPLSFFIFFIEKLVGKRLFRSILTWISLRDLRLSGKRGYLQMVLCEKKS